uniref:Zinc finger protein 414 n=1 Tax=Buteo japonicus TaxID=224669 RepID=A0A8C0APX1_9AVES
MGAHGCAGVYTWHHPVCSRCQQALPSYQQLFLEAPASLAPSKPDPNCLSPSLWFRQGPRLVSDHGSWRLLPNGLSPAGCSEAALPGGPMLVAGSGGTPAPDLRPLKRRPVPGKHYQCSSYGCKLAFPSMQELMDHLKVHYRPTQSLEGKTFHCPTLGCTETFPSMQDLMAHMKVHYKPNRYFKCENCMLRFRTHRSLFKHLHVCSDSASNPAPPPKADKPVLPATSALEKEPPAKPPEGLPKLPSVIRPPEKEAILLSLGGSGWAAGGGHRGWERPHEVPRCSPESRGGGRAPSFLGATQRGDAA